MVVAVLQLQPTPLKGGTVNRAVACRHVWTVARGAEGCPLLHLPTHDTMTPREIQKGEKKND